MKNETNLVNRRNLLRTVGAGLAVGSVGALSGCLGDTDGTEADAEIGQDEITGETDETDETEEEPSADSSLAGSATGEPSGIERHNMSFRGRYNANHYRPYTNYKSDYIYIYNMGGYVIQVEVFDGDVDDGEPALYREFGISRWRGFKGYGDIRISVVGSNESLVIDSDVRNVEIWMGGAVQTAHYWAGDF